MHAFQDSRCRASRQEWDDHDLASRAGDGGAFIAIERFDGVVTPFDVNFRLRECQKLRRTNIWKDAYGRDGFERSQHHGAIILAIDRAVFPFQGANGGIAIEAHKERRSLVTGVLQISNVPGMEDIEATVGDNERRVGRRKGSSPRGELRVGNKLCSEIHNPDYNGEMRAWKA